MLGVELSIISKGLNNMEKNEVLNSEKFVLSPQEKVYDMLLKVGKGEEERPKNTIDNFEIILENDEFIRKHIQYNDFNNRPEYVPYDKKGHSLHPRYWQDSDDAYFMAYIEKTYNVYDNKKFGYALINVMKRHSYNPVKDLIEKEPWDGVERIDDFLEKVLKCTQNSEYLREVSRMMFYGGISRV